MLAEKSLLSMTLAAAFAAGGVTGFAVRDTRAERPYRPDRAEDVFAARLAEFRAAGFDASEMSEALRMHQAYLDGYSRWWRDFLEAHKTVLEREDDRFEAEVRALEARVAARTGRASPTDAPRERPGR
ncbi:MAG: hypothetical protein HMLKMBBP_01023 [Planctomycetes bacterium]|nr:hypothetical protein [Planctomycetota bacterium]